MKTKWTGGESLEVWQWHQWPEPPADWVAVHQRGEEMDHECRIPRVTQPLLKQEQHHRRVIGAEQTENRTTAQGFFFSHESRHCISFWNQGPESDDSGEAQNPICLKSRTLVHAGRIWASVFSAAVALLHFIIMSSVNTASTERGEGMGGGVRALHVAACWQALQTCWCSFSSRTVKVPTEPKRRPAAGFPAAAPLCLLSQPGWSPLEKLCDVVHKTIRDTWATVQMSWKAAEHLNSVTGSTQD